MEPRGPCAGKGLRLILVFAAAFVARQVLASGLELDAYLDSSARHLHAVPTDSDAFEQLSMFSHRSDAVGVVEIGVGREGEDSPGPRGHRVFPAQDAPTLADAAQGQQQPGGARLHCRWRTDLPFRQARPRRCWRRGCRGGTPMLNVRNAYVCQPPSTPP
jgi:hypothetical protein